MSHIVCASSYVLCNQAEQSFISVGRACDSAPVLGECMEVLLDIDYRIR